MRRGKQNRYEDIFPSRLLSLRLFLVPQEQAFIVRAHPGELGQGAIARPRRESVPGPGGQSSAPELQLQDRSDPPSQHAPSPPASVLQNHSKLRKSPELDTQR